MNHDFPKNLRLFVVFILQLPPRLVIILPFICLLVPAGSQSQNKFEFSVNCRNAYQEIIRLRLSSGQSLIDEEKRTHPDNLIPYFLENYIDFFVLFFNEDPKEFAARSVHEDKRLRLMDQASKSSPFLLFSKSMIHFQWAAIKIKFGKTWDAGWEFRRSFLQTRENQMRFPEFTPNAMLGGAMQVVAGTIPEGYQWLSNLLGMRGDILTGMRMLNQFIGMKDPLADIFKDEAIFYFLYLKFYIENKRDEVFEFLKEKNIDLVNNHLFAYLAANLALNNQQSARAEQIILQKNHDPAYFSTPVWDFEMGWARLNHLEPDANRYLEKFLMEFRGKFYVKEALQKLSWFYFLQGDIQKADSCRRLILQKGSTEAEADKQALKDAKSNHWPNQLLLKARLFNDGGYNERALQLLNGLSSSDFSSLPERLEFAYRLARIYDDLGRHDDAIAAYLTTIKLGSGEKEYYAARAALQVGFIYEHRGDCTHANAYYQKCLDLKDHEYKNSLDQKAKAGMLRCKAN